MTGASPAPDPGQCAAPPRALGLDVEAFRRLMDERRIAVLCERGTDADAGLYRATFYFERRRARLIVDGDGHVHGPVEATDGE